MGKKFYKDRTVYYNEAGKYHNEDGPAVEWYDGDKQWWINGNQITLQEFIMFCRSKKINNILDK